MQNIFCLYNIFLTGLRPVKAEKWNEYQLYFLNMLDSVTAKEAVVRFKDKENWIHCNDNEP
mgnify:CR=1 FL=1